MSPFEEARRYFAEHWRWRLHEETFQQLDKETWICKMTTMWKTDEGKPEDTCYLLYDISTHDHFFIDEAALPVLLDWCLKMAAKGGTDAR